jgi:hypothetical protein
MMCSQSSQVPFFGGFFLGLPLVSRSLIRRYRGVGISQHLQVALAGGGSEGATCFRL